MYTPAHPLIHAFLLEQSPAIDARHIIVADDAYALSLVKHLEALQESGILQQKRDSRVIKTGLDRASVEREDMRGIWTIDALMHPPALPSTSWSLALSSGLRMTEEQLSVWLSEHGYIAKKSLEAGTYLRQGDTVSFVTSRDTVRVSFFGQRIEDIWRGSEKVDSYTLIALRS